MALTPGTRLGPYEVLAPLGAGGMGEVYRAWDPKLDREVAVKVLPQSLANDPGSLPRFEREAKAVAALSHPNILAIYDFGSHEGVAYAVTELLEGETLRGKLAAGPIPRKQAVDYSLQIAKGLSAAHEKGIVHRDLKPENLFVTRDGHVKILDFGLAKRTERARPQDVTSAPTEEQRTEPGTVIGTIGYMSPEQVRGLPVDHRSDIFSFGAVLYEMLSGKRAFQGQTPADTMSAILKEDPPDLFPANPNIVSGLERVIRHCLEKDPERRFHSLRDLAFELETPSASAPTTSSASARAAPRSPGRRTFLVAALAVALALAVGAVLWQRAHARNIDSVAVLPFTNMNSDPSTEYLSDGIAESLINSLSRLDRVRVVARSVAFHYRDGEADLLRVGRELNVRAVLSGKVHQRGDTLVVQAELVDVANGSQLWGDRFDRNLSDLLAIQDEIAREISEKLRPRLTGEEKKRLAKHYTQNTEAYQLYLNGRHSWEKRTPEALQESIRYFKQAIAKDEGYVLAYAGLADAYAVLPVYSIESPREAFPKARAAAAKAFEIDDSLAQPHATLAIVLLGYDWDWTAAESELKKAIALDPSYPIARQWLALVFTCQGRFDESFAQLRRARELDPFSVPIQASIAMTHLYARQYDVAIEEGRKVDSTTAYRRWYIAQAYEAKKMTEQALAEYQKAVDLSGRTARGLMFLGESQALAGKQTEALGTIEEMKTLSTRQYVSPSAIAVVYAELDEKDPAFEWLEKAYTDHSWDLIYLGVDPRFDTLRTDPRFADLLRRIHLAPHPAWSAPLTSPK